MAAELGTRSGRRAYRAMSCTAHAVVVADRPEPLLEHVAQRLVALESRWSRFRPGSEISGLNRAAGSPLRVSVDTARLVESLVQAWHLTDGAFDPTLLGTLVELGYAASRTDATARTSLAPTTRPIGRPELVRLDRDLGVVQLPPGTTLDPGGLGKGLAADLIVQELIELGADGALVEVGGDLRVEGLAPASDGWPVAIGAHPAPVQVTVGSGAVATSSSRRRTWRHDGQHRHHLLDPRTLAPTGCDSEDDVVACTVIAGSAATAEAFTKVAFVLGHHDATEVYERHGLAALITTEDGCHTPAGSWAQFAGGDVDR